MRMFRQRFAPSPTSLRARLTLEALDMRSTPSSITDPTGLDSTDDSTLVIPDSAATQLQSTNDGNAPEIVDFTNVEVVGGVCTFSGQVIDQAPAGLTITLGGQPPSVQGVKIVTGANGQFSKSVLMTTGDNGIVTAQTVDGQGLSSNVAMTLVTGN